MWFRAGLACAQFTLFARLGSAGGATHGEDLFRTEFFLHGDESIREHAGSVFNSERTSALARFGAGVKGGLDGACIEAAIAKAWSKSNSGTV